MPAWVESAVADYAKRMPRELPLEVVEIPPASRAARYDAARAMAQEGERLLGRLSERDHVIALEVVGRAWDTPALAKWLEVRRLAGQNVALLIGGADGLDPAVSARAHERLSLSPLTLPHAIARVVLVEQLYRAWTIIAGHPYHRGSGGRPAS